MTGVVLPPVPVECPESPDKRHKWKKIADGGDSNELFQCEYCHGRIWD